MAAPGRGSFYRSGASATRAGGGSVLLQVTREDVLPGTRGILAGAVPALSAARGGGMRMRAPLPPMVVSINAPGFMRTRGAAAEGEVAYLSFARRQSQSADRREDRRRPFLRRNETIRNFTSACAVAPDKAIPAAGSRRRRVRESLRRGTHPERRRPRCHPGHEGLTRHPNLQAVSRP